MLYRRLHSKLGQTSTVCLKFFGSSAKHVDVPGTCQALLDRGLVQQTFPIPAANTVRTCFGHLAPCVYAGFDPTSDSLHVGNLVVLNGLLQLFAAGFKVIVVIGDSTARLGDPSGREFERDALAVSQIQQNSENLRSQIGRIFKNFREHVFCGSAKVLVEPIIVNNSQWYENMDMTEFLGTFARHFRVGAMLRHRSIRTRMEKARGGMCFSEFAYQILQAYDWLRLFEAYDCRLQLGGSDQTSNIEGGHDLIKALHSVDVYGLLLPLILDQAGRAKLSKSASNCGWLDRGKTTAFELYQYFIRQPDSEVEKLLKLFTFHLPQEINKIVNVHAKEPHKRAAQTKIAETVVKLVHGPKELASAVRCTKALYENDIDSLDSLSAEEIELVFRDVPSIFLDFDIGISLLDLVQKAGLFRNSESAERMVVSGGVYVNNARLQEPNAIMVPGAHILMRHKLTVLRIGKKQYMLVRWNMHRANVHIIT